MYLKKWFFASKALSVAKNFPLCYLYHSNFPLFIALNQMLNNGNVRHHNIAKYLRQSVTITGLNVPNFTKAIENLVAIQNMFARHVKNEDLDLWQPTTYNEHPSIELSNRYFTYRIDDPHSPSIPLGPDVDPTGRLAALAGGNLFHSEDNVVLYRTKLNNLKE